MDHKPRQSEIAAQPPGRVVRLMWGVTLSLMLVLGLLLGYRRISSPDIGFHLSYGRWIVENGGVPRTDPLTYTVADHPVVDPQWLFQAAIYELFSIGGTAMIVELTTMLTLLFGAMLLWRDWRRERRLPLSGMLLLLLFFLGNQWEIRPHLLSWCWGSAVLLVLEEYARGNRRWLPLLPVVMVLWVNTHSLFVLGLVIMGAYIAAELIRLKKPDKKLWCWCLVAAPACLINPYHYKAVLLPLLQFREIHSGAIFKSQTHGLAEFTSPFNFKNYVVEGQFVLFQTRLFWQLFIALAVAGMAAGWRRVRLVEWIIFAGFLYIFWSANKNFGYFVMACFPPAAAGLDRLGAGLAGWFSRRRATDSSSSAGRGGRLAWLAGCGLVCVLLIAMTWTGTLDNVQWAQTRRGDGFDASQLPVRACQFIADHHIRGRLLNIWDDGGYVAWATNQKVFIYGVSEVVGDTFYQQYIRMEQPDGFPAALDKWHPTVAIVRFKSVPFWLFHLHRLKTWRLVYADQDWGVFLHESVSPEIPAMARAAPDVDYPVYDTRKVETIIRRASRAPSRDWGQWLRGPSAYPTRETAMGAFYLHTGQLDACIGTCLSGLDRTPFVVPDLMLTLGHALNARRRYDLADLCFDTFLRSDDEPVIRWEIEAARRRRR